MVYINWVIEHWVDIIAVLGALHASASTITAATKTPKDDEILAKVYKVVELVALVVGRAKQLPTKDFGYNNSTF